MRHLMLGWILSGLFVASLDAQSQLDTFAAPLGTQSAGGGAEMALLDDLDGDGLRDPVIAMGQAGTGYLDVRSSDTGATLLLIGPGTQDSSRISISAIDDLDGDGYRDVVAGFPGHSTGAVERGIVRVYSGRTGKLLRSHVGAAAHDEFGYEVCAIGDANSDGVADYAVGAPGVTSTLVPFAGPDAGAVTVFSGTDGSQIDYRETVNSSRMGIALALLGDLDGDGRPTLAIGAPGLDRVFVYEVLGNQPTTMLTSTPGTEFGAALASVGDVDGDGRRDLAIGQPSFQLPSNGTPGGRVAVHGSVSGNVLLSDTGWSGYCLGWDVADPGDVDGDGVGDVLVSSAGNWLGGASAPYGLMRILSGANGNVLEELTPGGAWWGFALAEDADQDGHDDLWMTYRWDGLFYRDPVPGDGQWPAPLSIAAGGQRYGEAVAMLDDLDGDGRPEIAVGGPHATPGDLADQGSVRVYSGTNVLYALDGAFGEQMGTAVVALGDLDDDGVGEFAIGRPRARFGNTVVGAASIYSGATGQPLRHHFGVTWGDRFGAAIARVPDTDGDGVDDYAIGAPAVTVAAGPVNAGRVSVYSGATGAHRYSIDGTMRNGTFGAALAGSDDLDGDGRGELLIGAPGETASLLLVGAGRVHLRSGASGPSLGIVGGGQPSMRFGAAVASIGDIDGDGAAEWLAGAPRFRAVARGDGRAQLHDGASGATIWSGDGAFQSRLGSSVAACGDIDNDGIVDFAVGEPRGIDPFAGNVPGRVRLYSGATTSWYQTLQGSEDGARFGRAVASGCDLDGDRMADFVIGSPDTEVSTPGWDPATGATSTWTARELGSEAFGSGTGGCAGDHVLTLLSTVKPGQPMKLRYSGMSATTFPILGVGTPLPSPGLPVLGFLAHVQSQFTLGLPLPIGTHGAHAEPIPNDPNLVGAQLHMQVFALWLAGCAQLPFDLSSSNGLTVTVL
ncbi:MAG: hypothetical protein ACE37K_14190 [Planctomycetota bacterium]